MEAGKMTMTSGSRALEKFLPNPKLKLREQPCGRQDNCDESGENVISFHDH